MTTHAHRTSRDNTLPYEVPKNFWKTAPVYPNKAETSSFNRINILDKSMGFSIDAITEYLSSG